jgi:hypothetical protein
MLLFGHIDPEDGGSKPQKIVSFLQVDMASYSRKLESLCLNVAGVLF